VLVPVLVLYGAGSEVVQGLIGRDAAVGDWVADVVGVLLGLVAWLWLARRVARRPDRLA
jgi:VanZ family protein